MTSLREGGNEYIPKGSGFVQADLCKGKTRHKGHKMQVKTKKTKEVTVSANCHLFRDELALFQCFPQNSLLLRTTATKNKQRKTNHKKQPTLKPTGFVNWLSRGHQRLEDF